MDRAEMVRRLSRLNSKLYSSCYGFYDSMSRYGNCFGWMKKCRAYERAAKCFEERLGF